MNLAIIHISDIHFRQGKPEGASSIINALINDIERKESELRPYELFLAITGDVVFRGMDSDAYIDFSGLVIKSATRCPFRKFF